MGECGNHAEYLRALDERPMDLFRLSSSETCRPNFFVSHNFCSLQDDDNVHNPHGGYV
jgi:hypothetical protein